MLAKTDPPLHFREVKLQNFGVSRRLKLAKLLLLALAIT
jgi:hypothetical protein